MAGPAIPKYDFSFPGCERGKLFTHRFQQAVCRRRVAQAGKCVSILGTEFFEMDKESSHAAKHVFSELLASEAYSFLPVFVWLTCLLCVPQVNGGIIKIAPEWKAHFVSPPVVENCVFERRIFSWGDQTNLYQVRYQANAFVMREIGSPSDTDLAHITGRNMYAGRFESNYWSIEGGRVLKVFPNADNMIKERRTPETSLIETPRRTLIGALFCGFHLLDPATIKWTDETRFTGFSFQGHKFGGEILKTDDRGRPTFFKWHAETEPSLQFETECKYEGNLDLWYYPTEVAVWAKSQTKARLSAVYRILLLKTSLEPLPANWFDSKYYFSNSASAVTLVVTNDALYTKGDGGVLEKVIDVSASNTIPQRLNHSWRRVVIAGFWVISTVGLWYVWKCTKSKTKD